MRIQQNTRAGSMHLYFLAFLALLSFISHSASASPTGNRLAKREDTGTVLEKKVVTAKNTAMFWYGRKDGKGLLAAADVYAQSKGLVTMQMTMTKGGVDQGALPSWLNEASTAYAKGCSGRVHVWTGDLGTTRIQTIRWWRFELPELTKPGSAVTEIIQIDATTGAKQRIWKSGDPQQGAGAPASDARPPSPLAAPGPSTGKRPVSPPPAVPKSPTGSRPSTPPPAAKKVKTGSP